MTASPARPATDPRSDPEAAAWRRLTARWRTLPDYLILGAQKAGTTSLHHYLEAHPAVLPAAAKEIHYFDLRFHRGIDWYRAFFPTTAARRLLARRAPVAAGDTSPYYLFHPRAPRRAAATVPDAKLIALLRDPVERAYSHYRHVRRLGLEDAETFARAIELEDERLAGEHERLLTDDRYESFAHRHHSYLARGRYAEQLRQWLEHYPRDRLLILDSRSLFDDPRATFRRVVEFLGLPPWEPRAFEAHNRGDAGARLDPGLRAELEARFAPDARDLQTLLGGGPAIGEPS